MDEQSTNHISLIKQDERDFSTPDEDCWHSTYGNFCKGHQALSLIFWVGPGDKATYMYDGDNIATMNILVCTICMTKIIFCECL